MNPESQTFETRNAKSENHQGPQAALDLNSRDSNFFIDVHCHLLPGIDDGPKDWNASLAMMRMAADAGIRTIVATPHQLGRYEKNTTDRILTLATEAQQRIHDAGLPLTVLPGADVRIQEDLPELVEQGRILTLGNSKPENRISFLLMELPHEQVLPLGRLLYRLQVQGITAILSHPERNKHLQENPEILRPWVQQGCLIQVTTGSITGDFGREALRVSRWLFRQNLVHLVATDAHNITDRRPAWRPAFAKVCQWEDRQRANEVFMRNPAAVIAGQPVEAPLPSSAPQTGFASWFNLALATLRG